MFMFFLHIYSCLFVFVSLCYLPLRTQGNSSALSSGTIAAIATLIVVIILIVMVVVMVTVIKRKLKKVDHERWEMYSINIMYNLLYGTVEISDGIEIKKISLFPPIKATSPDTWYVCE